MLEIQRLHARFVAIQRPGGGVPEAEEVPEAGQLS